MGWGEHLLGRFRISVTTDDRSTFADGEPSGGDVTAHWIALDPISFTAVNGTTLTELSDHSILASGDLPDTDIYTVVAVTTLTGITGIRLEALTDSSLPYNGPGRQPLNGNFTLSEFSVSIDHPNVNNPVALQQATATFSQTLAGDFSIGKTINGTTADGLGWAIYPNTGATQIGAYETTSDIGYANGSLLTFTLDQSYMGWGEHLLGRFRISVTTDDRSTFCDGLPTGGDVTANWTVLDPISFTADGGTLTKLSDHSILAGGTLNDTDFYTVKAKTTLTGITGIRLEALTDSSLPYNGPGRQPLNGNFTLSEFTVGIEQLCATPSSHPTITWSSSDSNRDGAQDTRRNIWSLRSVTTAGAEIISMDSNEATDFINMSAQQLSDMYLYSAPTLNKMLHLWGANNQAYGHLTFWDMGSRNNLGSIIVTTYNSEGASTHRLGYSQARKKAYIPGVSSGNSSISVINCETQAEETPVIAFDSNKDFGYCVFADNADKLVIGHWSGSGSFPVWYYTPGSGLSESSLTIGQVRGASAAEIFYVNELGIIIVTVTTGPSAQSVYVIDPSTDTPTTTPVHFDIGDLGTPLGACYNSCSGLLYIAAEASGGAHYIYKFDPSNNYNLVETITATHDIGHLYFDPLSNLVYGQ
jgi:hypothetical protein